MNKKPVRARGKLQLSKYFQELKKGDSVAVVAERSLQFKFPKTIQGRTGIVEEKRGRSYLVKIKDFAKEKSYLIAPIHLKQIKQINSKE
jgi:ribosomal protein L21E